MRLARLLGDMPLCGKKEAHELLINHISSSFVGMVQWWIKDCLAQTLEELTDYFMVVILPVIS